MSTGLGTQSCKLITPQCVGAFTNKALAGISSQCFSNMPSNAFGAIADGIDGVSPTYFASLPAMLMANMSTAACGHLTDKQMAQLQTALGANTCSQVRSGCAGAFDSSSLAQISSACFNSLPNDAVHAFNAAQVGAVPPTALASSSSRILGSLEPSACSGLTDKQLAKASTCKCFLFNIHKKNVLHLKMLVISPWCTNLHCNCPTVCCQYDNECIGQRQHRMLFKLSNANDCCAGQQPSCCVARCDFFIAWIATWSVQ